MIFSYEMSEGQLLKKIAKILNLNWENPLDYEELMEQTKHLYIVDMEGEDEEIEVDDTDIRARNKPDKLKTSLSVLRAQSDMVGVQDWELYKKAYEEALGVTMYLLLADYMGIIPVRNINNPSKWIPTEVERISLLSGILPRLSRKLKMWILLPAQPTQTVEGGGRVILMPSAAKGGYKNVNQLQEELWKNGRQLKRLVFMKSQTKAG